MNLRQAIDILNITIPHEEQEFIKSMGDFDHFGFGMWLRNTCRLWEDGTKDIVSDILKLPNSEKYTKEYAVQNDTIVNGVDVSIGHPDNCSHVMFLIYKDYLAGNIQLG